MTVEISSIQNEVLRHAAEVADLNDNTANSGKLDQNEISVFIREAVKSDCNMAEIKEVCNQVGVEQATDDVKASMEKLNQLQKLEKELEYQNNILNKRYDEIDSIKTKDKLFVGGCTVGGAIALAIGACCIAGGFSLPLVALASTVGGLFGNNIGEALSYNGDKADEYQKQAEPIERKVTDLKNQMKVIEESL